ncbi:hypothetical protein JRO89_XS13G0084100 [Xanthoceras sorbifolium]|uniref:Amino acid transporter transmembrane domain-containing protein n=1 Tax=Xanthoceras sorbifolium TaxID=99658 RepID=A0ABQ8H7B2_9ROSI|nr:hypothetical protein JRO89_XS13G0084100 [Xanthoceras sorbifolium]
MFNAFGAITAIVFSNSPGMLPETQNMRKALYVQFTVGLLFYYGVTIVGYWAYGSSVSVYLPQLLETASLIEVFINSAVFLQAIVSQHMFLSPIHETLDTNFLKLEEIMFSRENIKRRFRLRTVHCFHSECIRTMPAAFPFLEDFVRLIGSFSLIPPTFLFPSMVLIKVTVKTKSATMEKAAWHWFNIVLFSFITVAATVTAVRLVIKDIQGYSFFADAST